MCGILAIFDPGRAVEKECLDLGSAALRHRGPDDQGAWLCPSGQCGLAQTRLAIIDLDGGHQPLVDGPFALVANGELYDHDRLLELLAFRGHRLLSRSDSEVALRAYQEMGDKMMPLLRGEFALALWDAGARRLFAARDRFGIKPLFYAQHQGRLLLASEVKALWAAGLPKTWDTEAVAHALHLALPQDRSLFAGVRQVPPGCYLVADAAGVRCHRYWDCDYPTRGKSPPSLLEALAEVSRLLHEAIRLRTRADVPLACYLSGGIDSSAVLGIAARLSPGKPTAFTVAFEGEGFDESRQAANMAAHAGADFVAVPVSSQALAEAFIPTVLAGEGLVYNGHAPARWLLSRALRQSGFKCALGGEGADELFAGYRFAEIALRASVRRSPLALWRRLVSGFPPPYDELRRISPSLGWLARGLGFPEELARFLVGQLMTIRSLAEPDLLGSDPYRAWLGSVPWRRLLGREPVKALLYLWTRSAFVNYVLAAERLDMANGVELRLPFLDHRLFEFTRELPATLLFDGQENKALLRQVAAPYVTSEVRRGAKQPFIAPPSRPLRDLLKEVILGTPDLPFFQRPALLRLLKEDAAGNEPLLCMIASFAVLHREPAIPGHAPRP